MNEFNSNGYNNLNNQNNPNPQNKPNNVNGTAGQSSFTYGASQQGTGYQNYSNNTTNGYTGFNQNGNTNEFSYSPKKPKKSAGKRALTAVVAVLCIAAIGTTSIVGYTLVTGNNPVSSTSAGTSSNNKVTSDSSSSTSQVDRTNLPTIEQLAAPSDAMSVPDIVSKVSPSVVGISSILSNGTSTGSGIVMSSDGYIITNAHVVKDAKSVSVLLPKEYASDDDSSTTEEDLTYEATIVGKDTQSDVAVLKIDAKDLTACEFGTSSDIQVGELSIVIGNPLGFALANSVTSGIISATDRTLTIEDRTLNYIQTDASINSGNSGGPLINAYGQVIGIATASVSAQVGEGLGFAIPIDEALPIIKDLMENGYVKGRPSLGITGTDVTAAYSQYYGIPQGFLVAKVTEGGGAEKAGIEVNDIIIGINDTSISSIAELNAVKNKCAVGDTVKITVYRDGKMVDFDVELTEATADDTTTSQDTTDNQQSQQSNGYNSYYNFFNNFGF